MKRTLVLFDIDGTILHSGGAGRRAITAALTEVVGPSHGFDRIRFDGKTDPQIVVELLCAAGHEGPHEDSHVAALCERYVALLEGELASSGAVPASTLLPGVPELLDALEREASVLLGLLTGNVAMGAELKLRAAGLDPSRFAVGAYGSDAAHRPHLPPIAARRAEALFGRVPHGREVVIVGDTPADVACGASVEAHTIGVATGAYSVDELKAAGASAVFADLTDTRAVVEAIVG